MRRTACFSSFLLSFFFPFYSFFTSTPLTWIIGETPRIKKQFFNRDGNLTLVIMHLCYHPHFDWLPARGYQWGSMEYYRARIRQISIPPRPLKLSENFHKYPCLNKRMKRFYLTSSVCGNLSLTISYGITISDCFVSLKNKKI